MHRDPGFKTIIQVAIVCRDIDATGKRWAALLGVDPPKSFATGPGMASDMVYRGKPSDARCKLAFIEAGACQLELIQPLGPGSSWQEALDECGESIHHIAFKVKNLDGSIRTCQELGMPVLHQGRFGSKDGSYVYIDSKSQLGAVVELLHWDKDGK
ncbi:MAG TPA: VOC family protein [Tepidisphaeraceae bacterium]|jgi:catechol 2,3-dioxygenase-like lactoylglutathione lyase family enzyme|nr:VOC family protein [Tepidisphaeraceae bacterium]